MSEQAFPGSSAQASGAAVGRARDGPLSRSERVLPVVLGVAALAATAGAVFVTAVSRHAPHPATHAILSVLVCLVFVGAGLIALRRPPYGSFGLLLCAVGFSSLLGALHDANGAAAYAIGVLTANLVFALLVHAVLAFPTCTLSRADRVLAITAYVAVLGVQAVAVLFDPLTRWHSDHPRNAVLVASHEALSTGLEELEAAVAIWVAIAVAIVLVRRALAATPPARRQLVPVVVGGSGGLLIFAVGLALAPVSSGAAVVGIGLGLLATLALPFAFLGVILEGRLSRAAVGELLVELREGAEPTDLQDALRRALRDPSLQLARKQADGGYTDRSGREIALPAAGDARVATPIENQGQPIGALVHDRSLRMRPELLQAVSAAAGFALANERALETVRQVEARNSALLDALPDLMIRVLRDGTYVDVRAEDPAELVRPPDELIGRNLRDVLPESVADKVLACVERALTTGAMSSVEYELETGGRRRWKESRMVPSGTDEVVTIVRDVTEERRAEEQLRRLADEQVALRRVATLVAADTPPEQVFQAVTEEICRLLGIPSAVLERFETAETATIVARYGERLSDFEVGTVVELVEGLASTRVLRTGLPGRIENYDRVPGPIGERVRAAGVRAAVAVPITLAGAPWGALVATFGPDEPEPPHTERRMLAFAELVSLGLASAQARDELAASRLRIVQAGDAERRRLERNLHDGTQQRLVALSVGLRLGQSMIRDRPAEAEQHIEAAAEELAEALTELRELAQGIHPAVLTERGLTSALEVLAARTPLPVSIEVRVGERLPEPVEAAAYYVVSEALANVVKHAHAEEATVRVARTNGSAQVEVSDDGAGGADPDAGSGLYGLRDRVETLDGRLEIASSPGHGTLVRAEIPLS